MRFVHGSFVLILAGAVGLAVACGGGTPPAGTPSTEQPSASAAPTESAPAPSASEEKKGEPAPTASATAEAPPAKPAWDDLSTDQRKELMKTVVIPQLGAAFKEFDAKKYADVKCPLCHGAGAAKDGKFKMPNPALPKLDPTDHFAKHMKKNEKITKFMMDKVVPEMAKALGMETYNPETQKGFGCGGCHTMVEMKGAKPAAPATTPPATKKPAGTKG